MSIAVSMPCARPDMVAIASGRAVSRLIWCTFASLLLGIMIVHAEPLVPAYERMHDAFSAEDSALLLATELNCVQCHAHAEWQGKGGPVLDGVGARLQPDWLRAFLTDPQATRPGTTMPDVLAAREPVTKAADVDALLHFLVSRKTGWEAPGLAKYSDPHHGGRQFRRLGCAACHGDPIEPSVAPRPAGLFPLESLEFKYSYAALTEFLQHPLKHRSGGRMPDFQLDLQEAADMAAYLIGTIDQADNAQRALLRPFPVDESKAQRGREIFTEAGCAHCHALGEIKPTWKASSFETLAGKSRPCSDARYGLLPKQQAVLANKLPASSVRSRVRHTLAALNCYACHQRDNHGGPIESQREHFTGDDTLGDEGRFPPALTGVGGKLRPAWLQKVLRGEARLRPDMHTQMPVFGEANVGHLAQDFATVDLVANEDNERILAGGDVEAGRLLLGTEGGVGCITCHALGEWQGLAMRALTLSESTLRYRPDWFRENLVHPERTRPGTLMPSFWPEGVAGNRTILEGDTDLQIVSIWAYLEAIENTAVKVPLPPGYPDFHRDAFEIIPVDRPVVQRTFIDGVGTHAIAVGFPAGVHLAFDAEGCRLAMAWRGRFLDAYNAWFSRTEPWAEPFGKDVKIFARADEVPRQFGGYILEEDGVPVFLYREGDARIRCRFHPNGEDGLTRTLTRTSAEGHSTVHVEEVSW